MISLIWKSLYSIDAYKKFVKSSFLKAVIFFLLLTSISAGLKAVSNYVRFSSFINTQGENIISQTPDFRIYKDKLEIKDNTPLLIKKDNGDILFGINPDFFEASKLNEMRFAFEKNRLSFPMPSQEMSIFYDEILDSIKEYQIVLSSSFLDVKILEDDNSLIINGEKVKLAFEYLKVWLIFILPVFYFVISLLLNTLIFALVAIPAYMMSLTRIQNLGVIGALKIAILASTPAIVFQTLEFVLLGYESVNIFYALATLYIVWRVENRLSIDGFLQTNEN